MWRFHDLPIRLKLTLSLAAIVSVVLLLASAAIIANDVTIVRSSMVSEYTTLANIVAAQSGAALSIADISPNAAQDVISDLKVEPTIVFAGLYDSDGKEVARHALPPLLDFQPAEALEPGVLFTRTGYLDVAQRVKSNDGSTVGSIYLRATTQELNDVITRAVVIVVVVFIVAIAIALLLAFGLQRVISAPILTMASTTKKVSSEHDYSIRVEKHGNDELGTLCDGFNAMLAEIQRRDAELANHRAELEQIVQQRTQDLEARRADLARANAALVKKNSELDDFAYVASHDLRSPLRAIDNLGRWIGKDEQTTLSEKSREDLEQLRSRVQMMSGLLEGLLQYSRIGRKEYQEEKIDIAEMLHKIIGVLDRPETIVIDFSDGMPTIMAPRVPLEMVFRNLIDNAIKHHNRPEGRIEIAAQDAGELIEFTITDDGPGIPGKHFDKIFQMFETLKGRSDKTGSGMGLALVKKTIETHHGKITVESEEGQGTTFRFTWPKKWHES